MSWWTNTKRRLAEALVGNGWSAATDADPDLVGFRRLTGSASTRDLDPLSQETMLKVCRWIYDGHAMGGWMVDHRVGLICGDELGFSVEVDPAVLGLSPETAKTLAADIKARLESFWNSPIFSMRYRADEMFTSYLVDGELCLPVSTVNGIDGLPQIDMVDVAQIKRIRMQAGSGLIAEAVVLTPITTGGPDRELSIVRLNPATGRYEGECFFFRNSRLANAARGRSDLLRQADWLDLQDQLLFARADKATLLNSLVWDVTVKGAGPEQVKAKRDEFNKNPPTRPGSSYVHNEQEELKAITPDLQAEDASKEAKHIQNFILGSKGIPESWFGGGGEVTRTTAGEQNDIALMTLRRDRKQVKTMFGAMLLFAYDQLSATQPKLYPPRALGGITIEPDLPPLDEKDISRLGGVVQNVVSALESAIGLKLVSAATGRKAFLHILDRMGVPVDPDTEAARIASDENAAELERMEKANAIAAKRIAAVPAPAGDEDAA